MSIFILKSEARGKTNLPWLLGKHSFSFGQYHDTKRQRFGDLIVFNDDVIARGKGFGAHPHENAEIVTLVLKGGLKHKDSMGNEEVIREGELQCMSAGTGVWHSEVNASKTEPVHLLQVWITPKEENSAPRHEHRAYVSHLTKNAFVPLVSGNKNKGIGYVHQNATFFMGTFEKGTGETLRIGKNRGMYVFVISGSVMVNGKKLESGDSGEIRNETTVKIETQTPSQVLAIEIGL